MTFIGGVTTAIALFVAGSAQSESKVRPPSCVAQKVQKKTRLSLPNGQSIMIDVVDTPTTREIGLMCRTRLPKDYGMLFVFPQEMDLTFWMKNTLVDLDMIWVGADKKISVIHERVKASHLDTPESLIARAFGRGLFVLELPSGAAKRYGLKEGDVLSFAADIPQR